MMHFALLKKLFNHIGPAPGTVRASATPAPMAVEARRLPKHAARPQRWPARHSSGIDVYYRALVWPRNLPLKKAKTCLCQGRHDFFWFGLLM
jgi:hypothetical protein